MSAFRYLHILRKKKLYKHIYLSGETIGMCVGGTVCSVSVSRLVGGLGLSGLLSILDSVVVSSGLEVTLRFSENRSNVNVLGNRNRIIYNMFIDF